MISVRGAEKFVNASSYVINEAGNVVFGALNVKKCASGKQ